MKVFELPMLSNAILHLLQYITKAYILYLHNKGHINLVPFLEEIVNQNLIEVFQPYFEISRAQFELIQVAPLIPGKHL